MKPLLPLFLMCSTLLPAMADPAAEVLAIFDKHCATCHNDDGDEDPPLTGKINLVKLQGEADKVKAILERTGRDDRAKGRMPKSTGKSGDPGYLPPLSKEERDALKAWAEGGSAAAQPAAVPTPPPAPPAPTPPPATPAPGAEPAKPAAAPAPEVKPAVASDTRPEAPPRVFIPLREEVRAIAADLDKVDPAKQPTTRYLTLTNLHNLRDAAGQPVESDSQLDIYRVAVSKLLNSISRAGRIRVPEAIDAAKTIYRFDLRDYALEARDWEDHVVKGYPYGLRGIEARSENDIARASHSAAAWVRADWFIFAASQPPLYHELLNLPVTEQALEKQEGVDTLANLRNGRALRAGFRQSGVSQGNRLIERHEASNGMYWKSYDFTPLVRTGGHDLFRSPLGPVGAGLTSNPDREFRHDGGEIIFSLPNGLHAYLLATSDGKRIDRGPVEIVQDRGRRDGSIINGISCMACHDVGMKSNKVNKAGQEQDEFFKDEIGPIALKAGLDRAEARHVQDLHATPEKLKAVIEADEAAYKAALAQATPGFAVAIEPVDKLYRRFLDEIRLETLAAEFGEEDSRFLKRLKDTRNADLESIAAQFESGLGFPRASWLDQFKVIAGALGYQLMDFHPIEYAEFTSGAPKAGGNEGKVTLSEGGRLTVNTDKAHYRKGELLTVKLKSTESAYVRLYHLSAEKTLTQIFPNSGRTDNFIKGGETVELGSQKQGTLDKGEFRFRMKEPFGTEIIFAVISPVQFTDKENLTFAAGEVFKQFQESDLREAPRRGTKGLTVEVTDQAGDVIGQRSAPTFTARAVFTVGP